MKNKIYYLIVFIFIFLNIYQCISITRAFGPPITGGTMTILLDKTISTWNSSIEIKLTNSTGDNIGVCVNSTVSTNIIQITCDAPPSPGLSGGVYNVSLSGSVTTPNSLFAFQPEITSVSLYSGNKDGPTVVLTGKGFANYQPFYISYQATGLFDVYVISSTVVQKVFDNTVRSGNIALYLLGSPSNQVNLSWKPYPVVSVIPTFKSTILYITGNCLQQTDVSSFSVNIAYYYQSTVTNNITILTCVYTPNVLFLVNCTGLPVPDNYSFKLIVNNTAGGDSIEVKYQAPILARITSLHYNSPGKVTIYGTSFAPSADAITVKIGSKLCSTPKLLDDEHIECYFSADEPQIGSSSLPVTVTSFSDNLSTTSYIYTYFVEIPCGSVNSQECSGNGVCDNSNGFCKCNSGWSDSRCSTQDAVNPTDPPITDDKGVTTIPADKTSFKVNMGYIREISTLNTDNFSIIKTLDISLANWNKTINSTDTHSILIGYFENNNCTIQIEITYYKNATTVEFAGQEIPIDSNSVKYKVKVFGWEFSNILNTLQVIFVSSQQNTTKCSTTTTESYWIQITSNLGSILTGKFSNRAIIDSRIYRSKLTILSQNDPLFNYVQENNKNSTIFSAIESPSFQDYIELDPNFSSLVFEPNLNSNQYIDDEGCLITTEEKFKTWKIIVICVCGGIGFIALVTFVILLSKKKIYYIFKELKSHKLKNLH